DGLDPRAAGHVHGEGGFVLAQPGAVGDLPGGVGAVAGLAGVTEHQLVDVLRFDPGPAQSRRHCMDPEVDRWDLGEGAEESAHGRTGALYDDSAFLYPFLGMHLSVLSIWPID